LTLASSNLVCNPISRTSQCRASAKCCQVGSPHSCSFCSSRPFRRVCFRHQYIMLLSWCACACVRLRCVCVLGCVRLSEWQFPVACALHQCAVPDTLSSTSMGTPTLLSRPPSRFHNSRRSFVLPTPSYACSPSHSLRSSQHFALQIFIPYLG